WREIIFACWFVFAGAWTLAAFSTKRTVEKETSPGRFVYAIFLVIGAYFLFHQGAVPPLSRTLIPFGLPEKVLGALLCVLGLGIALWARFTLGRNWSGRVTLKEDHELIQRGPYAFVRHPIYTGLLLMVLASALAGMTLGGVLAFVLFAIGLFIKLRKEEAL